MAINRFHSLREQENLLWTVCSLTIFQLVNDSIFSLNLTSLPFPIPRFDSLMAETEATSPNASQYRFGWRLYVVIACLFFGSFLIALDTNIINIVVPQISSDFHALDDVAWYGTAYLLTLTAFQPIFGSGYKFFRTDIVYSMSIRIFEGKGSSTLLIANLRLQ